MSLHNVSTDTSPIVVCGTRLFWTLHVSFAGITIQHHGTLAERLLTGASPVCATPSPQEFEIAVDTSDLSGPVTQDRLLSNHMSPRSCFSPTLGNRSHKLIRHTHHKLTPTFPYAQLPKFVKQGLLF